MEISKDILNELKGLSPLLAGMQKVNVFTVPNGYFERLAEDILLGTNEAENNLLGAVPNQPAMQVPQGYFESLADNILNKIKIEESAATELKTISPILHSIQNKNVYTVPDNYFETSSAKILDAVKPQKAKLVTMRKRTAVIFKYAVAAVFTGMLALGVLKFTGDKTEVDTVIAEGNQIARDNKFDEEMAKVTDADIVKYLEENNSDADVALVANTIDENELPTEEDYLTDDKALDKYLDNINVNDLKN